MTAQSHLGITADRLLGPRAGVGRYLAELLREWAGAELPFASIILYVPALPAPEVVPEGPPFQLRLLPTRGPLGIWEQVLVGRAATREVDVLFCPSYVVPMSYRGPVAVTIHDALHELLPSTFPRRRRYRASLYRYAARRAEAVIADSGSTAEDIQRLYHTPPTRVHTIPLGVDLAIASASAEDERRVRRSFGLGNDRVVLFVGKFARRRHLPELVQAFARVKARLGGGCALMLVGGGAESLPAATMSDIRAQGRSVHVAGHVPEADLRALYRAASVFVYPSDYEGFGLPVLEAMATGTPVITLDNSSLREVAHNCAVLLPAATVDALAEAILTVLGDPELARDLGARGRQRATGFSWSATAQATMQVLGGLLERDGEPVPRPGISGGRVGWPAGR